MLVSGSPWPMKRAVAPGGKSLIFHGGVGPGWGSSGDGELGSWSVCGPHLELVLWMEGGRGGKEGPAVEQILGWLGGPLWIGNGLDGEGLPNDVSRPDPVSGNQWIVATASAHEAIQGQRALPPPGGGGLVWSHFPAWLRDGKHPIWAGERDGGVLVGTVALVVNRWKGGAGGRKGRERSERRMLDLDLSDGDCALVMCAGFLVAVVWEECLGLWRK